MKKNMIKSLAAALSFAVCMTGCSSGNTSSSGSVGSSSAGVYSSAVSADSADTTLKWALDSDIVSLDPIYAYDTTTNLVVVQVVESLLYINPDGSVSPMLAKSWECVDDKTYVYEIRDDVTFSDGTPMTVDDVIFSMERNMGDGSDSYVAWMFDSVDSIEKTGDWEITVHLKNPDAFWQYVPATTGGAVISEAYYNEHKDNFGTASGGILATGAYKFDHWTNGSEIVLTENENYWDDSAPVDFKTIDYTIISEDTTRIAALKTGQIDFSVNVSVDMISQLSDAENLTLDSVHAYRIDHLAFNTEKAPFNDVNVRKAIAYAIDAENLVNNIYGEYGQPGSGLLFGDALYTIGSADDWQKFADTLDNYSYNIEKAKECLAASAYPDGFDCRLAVSNISYYQSMAVYIQAALAEIGINVSVEQHTYDEMITIQFGNLLDADGYKDYDMGLFDWQADFPDPAGNVRPILISSNAGAGGSNTSSFKNADVDALFTKENNSVDEAERVDLIKQYSEIILDQVPVYVLCFSNQTFAVNKRFTADIGPLYFWDLTAKDFKLAQ
ncbi:MAG: ABC transporter substrate-binding protein [Oscillospiraceae bacterium]|nr:ABC transporter substrate-binding protein [Oscillospiraceae bacterium]